MRAVLQKIRQAVREQRYRIGSHANDEMSDDNLTAEDIENIIITGQVSKKYLDDPRGPRYKIKGSTTDGRSALVICRFLSLGALLIITAFAEEEE